MNRQKILITALVFTALFVLTVLFFTLQPAQKTLPPESKPEITTKRAPQTQQTFTVSYHELGGFYKVSLNAPDSQELRNQVNQYFSDLGLTPANTKVIYLTLDDQRSINNLIYQLPRDTAFYSIIYGPKTDTFFLTLYQKPFEASKNQTLLYLRSQGLDDLSKINLVISEAGRPMSPE